MPFWLCMRCTMGTLEKAGRSHSGCIQRGNVGAETLPSWIPNTGIMQNGHKMAADFQSSTHWTFEPPFQLHPPPPPAHCKADENAGWAYDINGGVWLVMEAVGYVVDAVVEVFYKTVQAAFRPAHGGDVLCIAWSGPYPQTPQNHTTTPPHPHHTRTPEQLLQGRTTSGRKTGRCTNQAPKAQAVLLFIAPFV